MAEVGDPVQIKGTLWLPLFRLGPGRVDINIAMVCLGGWLVGDHSIYRDDGGFVQYTRTRLGGGYIQLATRGGKDHTVRFSPWNPPRMFEVLRANRWSMFEPQVSSEGSEEYSGPQPEE